MSEVSTIIRQLQKGKNPESGLAVFGNSMMSTANRLSFLRLVMNYSVLYETVAEFEAQAPDLLECSRQELQELNQLMKEVCQEGICGETQERLVGRIGDLRRHLMEQMHGLTYFTDRFVIEEYVMNRLEYRFRQPELTFDRETFIRDLLQYITAEDEQDLLNYKVKAVIEQLPLRMTKSRFFQLIQDGFSVYKGSERQTVKDLCYMIRTAALLEEPEEMDQFDPKFRETCTFLAQIDPKTVTADQFEMGWGLLHTSMERLNSLLDLYMAMQEMVNDLYVVFLSAPYAMYDVTEREQMTDLILQIHDKFDEGCASQLDEAFYAGYEPLEGMQERFYETFSQCDAALEEFVVSYEKLIPSLMLDKIYHSLQWISKLLSDSLFIVLEEEKETEKADENWLREVYCSLQPQLEAQFRSLSKLKTRAVMSRILTYLPPFINQISDLEEYISTSFSACTDEAERYASMEILHQMMME